MTTPTHRWYHLTLARFFVGLLVVQVVLLLSEQLKWFPFNEKKGWTVLIAVGVVGLAVLVMLLWGLVGLCLRRRFQFGVRSLLLFMVTVSIPLGWFAWEMEQVRRQREAVERIVEAGGYVGYDYQYDRAWRIIDGAQPSAPQWVRNVTGDDFFQDVVVVVYFSPVCDDAQLEYVRGFARLENLNVHGTGVTDAGLECIRELTELQALHLAGTSVTDIGLKHLDGLTRLRFLKLAGSQVTREGVKELQQALPNCEIVH